MSLSCAESWPKTLREAAASRARARSGSSARRVVVDAEEAGVVDDDEPSAGVADICGDAGVDTGVDVADARLPRNVAAAADDAPPPAAASAEDADDMASRALLSASAYRSAARDAV